MESSTESPDEEEIRSWLVGVNVSMPVLSAMFVCLRILSRRLMQQRLWWDDYIIIISGCCNLGLVGLVFAMYHAAGLGLSIATVEPRRTVLMAKLLVATETISAWNLCLTKTSILLMYYRTFHLWMCSTVYIFIIGGIVLAWAVTTTFTCIFTCVPVQKLWYPDLPGHCLDRVVLWAVNAGMTLFTDIAILLFPVPQVWSMKLRLMQRVALIFVFALGIFVIFAYAYRFYTLLCASQDDPTLTLAPTIGWTEIEIAAGIIVACLPLLNPILCFGLQKTSVSQADGVAFSGGSRRSNESKSFHDSAAETSGDRSRKVSVWTNSPRSPDPSGGVVQGLSSYADAWDWERNVDGQTRAGELGLFQRQASAARSGDADQISVPMHGISVTRDFRRWSVVNY